MSVRVAIIEDDKVIREGFEFLIGDTEDYFVTGYDSFEKAIKNIKNDFPHVILLDIDLPGISGIEAIPMLKRILPKVHILMLTVHDSETHVFTALQYGAAGYIVKSTPPETIISSIREVLDGGAPMSATVARMVIKSFQKNLDTPLSKREAQVLDLIAVGKSRIHIAKELFIEPGTLKTHIKNIYMKLEVNSKEEALKIARANKLIK
jgi:DNA-binding NarL/FixJ family response regulator